MMSAALIVAATLLLPQLVVAQSNSNSVHVHVDSNVMVRMRDGVHLATDVYRPDTNTSQPAILVRTPYGKDTLAGEGPFFAQHGYVYVVQDTRGRSRSEGTFEPYVQDDVD
ncbi:MAG: CocE/NonD family hydrolase, partial [Chloroflexi bacterium]|nr:CocE/NonD family hydrolase [Chloroflexota bacterium]